GVKTAGTLALRAFADMDVAALPGFEAPTGFRF
ncbi:MAG: protein-L-isoaspartate O-methyltransferase, partial [Sphingopyxis terrae]